MIDSRDRSGDNMPSGMGSMAFFGSCGMVTVRKGRIDDLNVNGCRLKVVRFDGGSDNSYGIGQLHKWPVLVLKTRRQRARKSYAALEQLHRLLTDCTGVTPVSTTELRNLLVDVKQHPEAVSQSCRWLAVLSDFTADGSTPELFEGEKIADIPTGSTVFHIGFFMSTRQPTALERTEALRQNEATGSQGAACGRDKTGFARIAAGIVQANDGRTLEIRRPGYTKSEVVEVKPWSWIIKFK